jgi:hypothetical protein
MTHKVLRSTLTALKLRRNGSLRGLAIELGFEAHFAATLSDMLRHKPGAVSLANENRLRLALGLPPRLRRRYTRPCLDLDPRRRIAQLERLIVQAKYELITQGREP